MATASAASPVRAALDAYRTHVVAANRQALGVYVPFLANAQFPDGNGNEDRDMNEIRLTACAHFLMTDGLEGISAPGDVLDRYEELATKVRLDGTMTIEDPETRAAKRQEYMSALSDSLREKSLEEVRGTMAIPEEFRELSEPVDRVLGPGQGYRDLFPIPAI